MTEKKYNYDLIVIGGGSGGLSCAKQAASLGAKVLLFDYVKPSTQGTTWSIGGTCVNVGCVPKKIMHYSGLLGHSFHDAKELGWNIKEENMKHNWQKLVQTVTDHIHMLNFRYKNGLKSKHVTYVNALAEFYDEHTLVYHEKDGTEKSVSAENIVIAVGGRPFIPDDIPGAKEYAITSDDIFFMKKKSPGKTLCIGGSYIALECAGFLTELGYDVSVSVRSILLRGFDRQCAEKIGNYMEHVGTRFYYNSLVTKIDKLPSGQLEVTFVHSDRDNTVRTEVFDTVLFATGRLPDLQLLGLEKVGVKTNPKSGKIIVDNKEQTNVDNIFAIGDVNDGWPELTPVAIKAGELLAKRLYDIQNHNKKKFIDLHLVPTTVFTPTEYGSIGYTEEEAIDKYGEDNLEIFLSEFTTLEISAVHRLASTKTIPLNEFNEPAEMVPNCFVKLICLKSENEKVIGFHFVGPNAGEITQGFALAVKLGATKEDFNDLISIHPTDAESFCSLSVTKRSGNRYLLNGCGGGVCG